MEERTIWKIIFVLDVIWFLTCVAMAVRYFLGVLS